MGMLPLTLHKEVVATQRCTNRRMLKFAATLSLLNCCTSLGCCHSVIRTLSLCYCCTSWLMGMLPLTMLHITRMLPLTLYEQFHFHTTLLGDVLSEGMSLRRCTSCVLSQMSRDRSKPSVWWTIHGRLYILAIWLMIGTCQICQIHVKNVEKKNGIIQKMWKKL